MNSNLMGLNNNVIEFEIEGIKILGNFENSQVIGLTEDGETLVQYIKKNHIIPKEMSSENTLLFQELMSREFFVTETKNQCNNLLDSCYLHVTDHCNLHCLGCYSYISHRNAEDDLSLVQIQIILKKLVEAGVGSLIISGGEPLFRKDLREICQYAKSEGIDTLQVISNGTMPKECYDQIIPFIDKLTISVDGYDTNVTYIRDEGIMPSVIDTIIYCKDKVETTFVATLHKKNLFDQQKYYELAERLDVDFNFSLLTVESQDELFKDYIITEKDFAKNIELANKISNRSEIHSTPSCNLECRKACGAGKKMISVSANGDVYPCHMLHRDELYMGNILEDSLESILFSSGNLLKDFTVDNKKKCKECKYKYLCGGGCNARAYLETGDFKNTDSTCIISKASLEGFFSQFDEKSL